MQTDGRGRFVAIEPTESGFWLEGEIRKLRVARTAADFIIVAARNADSLQFTALRTSGRHHVTTS